MLCYNMDKKNRHLISSKVQLWSEYLFLHSIYLVVSSVPRRGSLALPGPSVACPRPPLEAAVAIELWASCFNLGLSLILTRLCGLLLRSPNPSAVLRNRIGRPPTNSPLSYGGSRGFSVLCLLCCFFSIQLNFIELGTRALVMPLR